MAYINAVALQKNYSVYINDDYTVGLAITDLPTPASGATIDSDYWAVPVTDGVVSGFNYTATTAANTDAPDAQAFHVVRISMKIGGGSDFWYIIGTSSEYSSDANAADCCATDSPVELPSGLPTVLPCQVICQQDGNGNYIGILGTPSLPEGEEYEGLGIFNGSDLTTIFASTLDNLVTQANLHWGSAGTWTHNGTTLIVTQTDGPGTDVLCAAIIAIPIPG